MPGNHLQDILTMPPCHFADSDRMGQGASRSIQESVLRADSESIREFAARGQLDAQDQARGSAIFHSTHRYRGWYTVKAAPYLQA